MGVAQKWLKPRPQKFSQLFARVFGSLFEILQVLQKISVKKGAFVTPFFH